MSVDYTPAANFNGTEVITYTVSDGTLTDATGTFTVTVTAVNDAPVAVANTLTVAEDAALTSTDVIANDTDVESDTLSLTAATTTGTGTVAVNADGLSVDYTPAANFNGTEVVTYTVSDGTDTTNGTFTVTSDSDQVGGANFGDNIQLRNFEITNDIYSLDGIGNHPSGFEFLGSLGTNSFTDAPDGLVCGTYYPIKQEEILNSVRVYITNSTVAQSEVILYILDSLSFTSGLFSNSIYTSDLYTGTAMDVSLGYIDIPVTNNTGWDPITNTSTWENVTLGIGGYYLSLIHI